MNTCCCIVVSDWSNSEVEGLKDGDAWKGLLAVNLLQCQRWSTRTVKLSDWLYCIAAKSDCAGHVQSLEKESASYCSTLKGSKTQHPVSDELASLFNALCTTGSKSAILSLIEPYSDHFVSKPIGENFPLVLTELRNEEVVCMDYSDVLCICKDVEISLSEERAKAVEVATRDQASSKLWFQFRVGRITSSKMKTACCTDPNQPAQSLIKSVC